MTFAHPFRLTASGKIAVVEPGSVEHAGQLACHVLSCSPGERGLAPLFGLIEQVGGTVDPTAVHSAISTCAPDLIAEGVRVQAGPDGYVDIDVTVTWEEGEASYA